ncbi:MAG TPA: trypsin-like peptidase domain-containing protein [Actinomycetes bacterium]
MSEEHRPGEQGPGGDTPWWSRPSGDTWDAPTYAAAPPPAAADEQTAPTESPTRPYAGPAGPAGPYPGPGGPYPGPGGPYPGPGGPYPGSGGPYAGQPGHPGSPWDAPSADTLGSRRSESRGPAVGLLVALAAAVALVAGGAGGAAGYLLAQRGDDTVTIDGANLGTAPTRSTQRPSDSIAGVAAKVLPSVVQIKVVTSEGPATGSGFVLDESGLILTNNHVVAGAGGSGVTVTFTDGTTTDARVVGTSASYDLAVLKVSARNLKPLPLGNSDSVVVGDPVIAIGSPLGLSGTVTSGIVSAKDRPVTAGESGGSSDSAYINAIQTDAAINPGNSGGPLVDLDGEVVGVNSAIATVGGALGGQGGNIGVGFAIPINQARRTAEQLIKTGEAQYPIIGASLDGTYDGDGARIASTASPNGTPPLVAGGPAEKAGLKPGDVIVAIDGKRVADSSELIVAIRSKSPGDTVRLTVRRDGDQKTLEVRLGSSKG